MKTLSATVLLTFILLHAVPSDACSCLLSPTCGLLAANADAVFVGTVTSKQLGENPVVNGAISSVVQSLVRFSVLESFKGVSTNEAAAEELSVLRRSTGAWSKESAATEFPSDAMSAHRMRSSSASRVLFQCGMNLSRWNES